MSFRIRDIFKERATWRPRRLVAICAGGVLLLSACAQSPAPAPETQGGISGIGNGQPILSGPRTPPGPTAEQTASAPALSSFPQLPTTIPAQPETTIITGIDDGKPRIGLLLPLTGPNAAVGKALLNAAQLALFDFAGDDFKMLTFDTKGTAEGAVDAVKLALGDGAKLIVGPLLAPSVSAISPITTANNVPVIAFSSDQTVAQPGVYTLGFLPGAQIDRVVDYARRRGVQRFAALVPQNPYGQAVLSAYRAAVLNSGAQMVDVRFYSPFAEGYDNLVRDLANYDTRRAALQQQIAELEGKQDEVSKRALKRLERLQTIGDLPYEALLVADGGARLQAIAALLPFYDIDPAKIRMLGTGQWDIDGIGAEPALVGGWFAAPDPGAREAFMGQYEAVYGVRPPRLATLAYDAVALAAVLGSSEDPNAYSDATLTNPSGFAGRDGVFRFLPSGVTERGLAVMQVGPRANRVVDRAPVTFERLLN